MRSLIARRESLPCASFLCTLYIFFTCASRQKGAKSPGGLDVSSSVDWRCSRLCVAGASFHQHLAFFHFPKKNKCEIYQSAGCPKTRYFPIFSHFPEMAEHSSTNTWIQCLGTYRFEKCHLLLLWSPPRSLEGSIRLHSKFVGEHRWDSHPRLLTQLLVFRFSKR